MAGTPNVAAPLPYPVRLYTPNSQHKLNLVREIVPPGKGLFWIEDDLRGRIFVAFPEFPTTLSIIHQDEPERDDQVTFSGGGQPYKTGSSVYDMLAAADDGDLQSYALFQISRILSPLANLIRGTGPVETSMSPLAILGNAPAAGGRVTRGDWSEYRRLLFEGSPGGPSGCPWVPSGEIADNHLWLRVGVAGRTRIEIAAFQPSPVLPKTPEEGTILAAGKRFVVFSIRLSAKDLASNQVRALPTYVFDREGETWKRIDVPGNDSRCRIFGDWLATIVEAWNPDNSISDNTIFPAGDYNPGRDGERNWQTSVLPNVKREYDEGEGLMYTIPGILVLNDLVDMRRIRIRTGQEDSEVLDVGSDGLVLYRVNDSIFSARIEGDKLSAPTLVVKDEDVPEIHWVFWSSANPNATPGQQAK